MIARRRSRPTELLLRWKTRVFLNSLLLLVGLAGCGREEPRPVDQPFLERQIATAPTRLGPPQLSDEASGPAESDLGEVPGKTKLPVYDLKMAPKDVQALERSSFSNQTVPATFVFNGEVYDQVQVRYRGAWARSWPKKPLKVFFNKDKLFQGQRCLNLNSAWRDPALVRECLAYRIYAACSAPASQARMVRLNLNGQFRGVYVEVEQPDQAFVKRLNIKGASVYKAGSRANQADERDLGSEEAFQRHYEKQTKKKESYRELQEFCHELARTTDVLGFFNQRVDLEKYINYLAAGALTQNWDGFNKNHYLIYDGKGSKKWFAVPWDLDRTLGDHWKWSFNETRLPLLLGTQQLPGVTGWNRLQDRFFSHPTLRRRFLDRLAELIEKEFTQEKLFPILDQLALDIAADATLDRRRWPAQDPDFKSGISQVKRFIEQRRAYLLREVQTLRRN